MNLMSLCVSRRSIAIAAALAGTVSLAIGAHAALNKRSLEAKVVATDHALLTRSSKVALVIGNGQYPDANAPLTQPVNDARALTAALRADGFDVDMVEDATKDDMHRAIERLKGRVGPGSVVMLFFGGYGVQAGHESYMLPVDAAIWKESDVRRGGISVEKVLDVVKRQGAHARLAVIDASRRNPYERRFRSYSHGLSAISAPDNALILSSAAPGKVADDSQGPHSTLVTELLNHLGSGPDGIESVFRKTMVAVSRASEGTQIPWLSSSLTDDIQLGAESAAAPDAVADQKAGG